VPHFTNQFQGGSPQIILWVGVSTPRQAALRAANQPVAPPTQIRGLVDTGASTTAIDPSVIAGLGIQPTGSIAILTPSTGATPVQVNTYDVGIVIPFGGVPAQSHVINAVQVFESLLTVQGIQALIGRDILSNCLLVYDGRANLFSLAF
jgi:predicted aspartyl protease